MGILPFNDDLEKTRKSIVALTILASIVTAALATTIEQQTYSGINDDIQQLPFCGDTDDRSISRRLLYVTTLDGKLTALDIMKNGNKHWSIETGPGPLISSSIHRLELTNNGQWVRMIPSLNGVLYKFNGETIDPIPITVDNLLSSSFKFSDDLVISGGKETRSYGISAKSGQVLYECSMNGCINATDSIPSSSSSFSKSYKSKQTDKATNDKHDVLIDDVILIRRQTQTVRAIEPRTGAERWNFSVGYHDLELLKSPECHEISRTDSEIKMLEIDIKIIVPKGILIAYDRNSPKNILWKYQFDNPIVNAWRIGQNDQIQNVDLFNSAQWVWNNDRDDFVKEKGWISPSLYIGMFQKQLYIQESQRLLDVIMKTQNLEQNLLNDESNVARIPWKPISATSLAINNVETAILKTNEENRIIHPDETSMLNENGEDHTAITALSVLYASEYVNGNGFFLFTSSDLNKTSTGLCDTNKSTSKTINETTSEDFDFNFIEDDETPVQIIIVSLWYWWKEIIVISITSAIVLNLFLTPRIRCEREVVVIERHIPVPTAMEAIEDNSLLMTTKSRNSQRSLSESNSYDSNSNGEFRSRFSTDFDLVQCLGKGGFGVVFEAKNKIDDCNYAVKRIILPNKKESRDRVMREVKTLANCEHQNIVRYFQAWIENPPPGWQEEEDKRWLEKNILSTSIDIETPDDGTNLPPFYSSGKNFNKSTMTTTATTTNGIDKNDYKSDKKLDLWISNIKSKNNFKGDNLINNLNDESLRKFNNNNNDDDDSCSFIQFKASDDDDDDDDDNENTNSKGLNETKININGIDKRFNPPQIELDSDDDSDSFKIEFRGSSNDSAFINDENSISVSNYSAKNHSDNKKLNASMKSSSNSKNSNQYSNIKCHKRPMSLDLSSKGNVIVPITLPTPSPTQQQQQQQQQNKIYLYIQMQLCRKESLKDWLREKEINMRIPHVSNIFEQIIDAVDYVHQKGLIHRDLKPSNIFFSLDGRIKIGDFGLVTDMPPPSSLLSTSDDTAVSSTSSILISQNDKNIKNNLRYTQQVGTHLYMSPEQLNGLPYNYKVDIYSLGLIFFELLVYFSTEMERIVTLKNLRNGLFPNDFHDKFPNEHELLKLMLSNEPEKRPTTFQIKEKLFFINTSSSSSSSSSLLSTRSSTSNKSIKINEKNDSILKDNHQHQRQYKSCNDNKKQNSNEFKKNEGFYKRFLNSM